MKNIKVKLILGLGLLAICLLPPGVRAADHVQSGITGLVETPGWTVEVLAGSNRLPIYVQANREGRFKVDLEPGKYELTPFTIQAPQVGPGQVTPNYVTVIQGPTKTVRVTDRQFIFVELPTKPLAFPFRIGKEPILIGTKR